MTDAIETCPIHDVFCTEVVRVERLGPCLRLWFTVPQSDTISSDGQAYRIVVAKLVVPTEEAENIARAMLAGPIEAKPTELPRSPNKRHVVN